MIAHGKSELNILNNQFLKILYVDFGIQEANKRLKEWYKLTWDEFKTELRNHQVNFSECILRDWEEFFKTHKQKISTYLPGKAR